MAKAAYLTKSNICKVLKHEYVCVFISATKCWFSTFSPLDVLKPGNSKKVTFQESEKSV